MNRSMNIWENKNLTIGDVCDYPVLIDKRVYVAVSAASAHQTSAKMKKQLVNRRYAVHETV